MSDSPIFDQVVEASRPVPVVSVSPIHTDIASDAGDGYDPTIPAPSAVCGYDVDRTSDEWPGEVAPILAPEAKGA